MLRALILDCGGVLMYPRRGHWLLPTRLEEILGVSQLPAFDPQAVSAAHAQCEHWISEDQLVTGIGREIELRARYTRDMARALNYPLSQAQARAIAEALVRETERHALYDDVLPALSQLSSRLSLGILSNAMPSILHTIMNTGLSHLASSVIISTLCGCQKPDAALYRRSLEDLGVAPDEAVFVDDLEANLLAAQALGIHTVRMQRPFYIASAPTDVPFLTWRGPLVRDLSQLSALLDDPSARWNA